MVMKANDNRNMQKQMISSGNSTCQAIIRIIAKPHHKDLSIWFSQ